MAPEKHTLVVNYFTLHVLSLLSPQQVVSVKRLINDFQYVCGTVVQNVPNDDRNPDSKITEVIFVM